MSIKGGVPKKKKKKTHCQMSDDLVSSWNHGAINLFTRKRKFTPIIPVQYKICPVERKNRTRQPPKRMC